MSLVFLPQGFTLLIGINIYTCFPNVRKIDAGHFASKSPPRGFRGMESSASSLAGKVHIVNNYLGNRLLVDDMGLSC